MKNCLTATVTKAVAGIFTAYANGKKYSLFAPKKLRYNELDILVGDKVTFEVTGHNRGVIEQVLPRRNRLVRPEIANVDYALIVLANLPQPDLLLIDKIIVNCIVENIKPVLVVNKCDMDESSLFHEIVKQYKDVCQVLAVSALSGEGVDDIRQLIEGHTACFAGQSAVGKTSLLNALFPGLDKKVGSLSAKTQRGTHTTRHSQIFPIGSGFVADTTGFSLLELNEVTSSNVMLFYDDFAKFADKCKYNMCTHAAEPQCAVKTAVQEGKLSKERYERYLRFFAQLQQAEKNKYD